LNRPKWSSFDPVSVIPKFKVCFEFLSNCNYKRFYKQKKYTFIFINNRSYSFSLLKNVLKLI